MTNTIIFPDNVTSKVHKRCSFVGGDRLELADLPTNRQIRPQNDLPDGFSHTSCPNIVIFLSVR